MADAQSLSADDFAIPERRDDILPPGMKSIVSGTLATPVMGTIVGVLH